MTEDQNPSSEPGEGQLLTSTQPPVAEPERETTAAPISSAPRDVKTPTPARPTNTKNRRWSRRLTAFAVVCALVIGAVVLTLAVEAQHSRDSQSLIDSQRERLDRIQSVLTAPDVVTRTITIPDNARVTAVFSAEKTAAVVTYQNLPEIPAKRTYQIFRVRDDKTKPMRILAPAARSGTTLLLGLGNGDALAFTVEPEGGSGQPTSAVVIGLRLS
jgi:anti-sigma-K factor RskA